MFKFELYRETGEMVQTTGPSVLEVCDQAIKDSETDTHTSGKDGDFVVFISFTLRREHCMYTVKQSRNAAVVLLI